jgi:signal transduction histidine kinase
VLTVRDDGGDIPGGTAEGFGLSGMRARAYEVNGRLDVDCLPGSSTTIRLELPDE